MDGMIVPSDCDTPGSVYGYLTLLREVPPTAEGRRQWECRCRCGVVKVVNRSRVRGGHVVSCGCYSRTRLGAASKTHGRYGSPIYHVWFSMLTRCRHANRPDFHRYGGRGITVCPQWYRFEAFLADMGERPSPQHTLERKDNNGNYEPGNCCWATRLEQAKNRRSTVEWVTFQGRRQLLREWARELGLPYPALRNRIQAGWPTDEVLTRPLKRDKRRKSPST